MNRIERGLEVFVPALERVKGDIDLLTVEEVDAGLTAATNNWDRAWNQAAISMVFGCDVTWTQVEPPDGHEDFSGPREVVYHIGARHFMKFARNVSHVGWEWDEYTPVKQVYPRTYTATVHDWAEV